MKILLAGLAASAVLAAPIASAPADAAGTPNCVSVREFNHMKVGTRTALENQWGVRGRGVRVSRNDPMPLGFRPNVLPDSKVMKYRLCGYGPRHGAVFAYFEKSTSEWYFSSYWQGQSPIVSS